MNFPDFLLPSTLLWVANGLALIVIASAALQAPWRRLQRPDYLNVCMAVAVGLMLAWSVKAGVKPGLDFHLLGGTLLTLMFGPWLALAVLVFVLLAVTISGAAGWASLGINFLLMAALPVLLSHTIFRIADTRLPNHLFVYIFVNAFLGAGLAMAACGIAAVTILGSVGAYSGSYLGAHYLPYFILMGWSEAMLTGMLITLLVAYRPGLVCTFSDERYLKTKPDEKTEK
jgi:uncharacterized membrane protein